MVGLFARAGFVAVLAAVGMGTFAAEITALGGSPAPTSLALLDAHEREHSLEEYRGRVLLVNFWASWCPPCLREFPSLEALKRELDGEPFDILAVNVAEGAGTLGRFSRLEKAGIHLVMDTDGSQAEAWNAEYYPTTYIIGPDGALEYIVVGEADWTAQEQQERIRALIPRR